MVECIAETGGEILLVPNGSPYWRDKTQVRLNIAVARVVESGLPLVYLNMVGGQDELVFDGASFGLNADRSIAFQLPAFRETVVTTQWVREDGTWRCLPAENALIEEDDEADYAACVLGLRDYVDKNGFKGVVFGLSGGIDSALCAAMAVDALGRERVRAVMLPYRYTSQDSLEDAAAVAQALGIQYDIVPIAAPVEGFEAALEAAVRRHQPRHHRGKSAVARARHHPDGDLEQVRPDGGDDRQQVGNVGRLRDALRRHERRLQSDQGSLQDAGVPPRRAAQHVEAAGALGPDGVVIPERVITKPPTAELRENQKDQDTLPPYDVLDAILERLVEREEPIADIVAAGFERDTVLRVDRMLNLAEYKRRQAAPGVKVTLRNFGRDRRYPIVNKFRDPGTPLPKPDETVSAFDRAKSEAFDF